MMMMIKQYLNRKTFLVVTVLIFITTLSLTIYGTRSTNKGYLLLPTIILPRINALCVIGEIEGYSCLLEIDSGSQGSISLSKELLKKISGKQTIDSSKWVDINDNIYTKPTYSIDDIRVGRSTIQNVIATEESLEFKLRGASLQQNSEYDLETRNELLKMDGRIGLEILRQFSNLYIDFQKSRIYTLNGVENGKKSLGITHVKFHEIPFEQDNSFIILSIETDWGVKKFSLDTGAASSVISLSTSESIAPYITTKKFGLANVDFGPQELHTFDLAPIFNQHIDGILGMDFIATHPIILDFEHSKMFVGPKISPLQSGP